MKTLILILKGLLLYATFIITAFWVCSLDTLSQTDHFVVDTFIMLTLFLISIKTISEKDLEILTFSKFFNKEDNQSYIIKEPNKSSNEDLRVAIVVQTNKKLHPSKLHSLNRQEFIISNPHLIPGHLITDNTKPELGKVQIAYFRVYSYKEDYKLPVLNPSTINGKSLDEFMKTITNKSK